MKLNLISKKIEQKVRAFTLIEFLIYFSMLAILLLIVTSVLFQVPTNNTKLETVEEVSQNARMAIEQLISHIQGASSINTPAIGQSTSSLSLVMPDNTKSPTVFDVSGGLLRIKEGSSTPITISTDEVTISNISFTNISYPNTPGAIRITLTVQSANTAPGQEYDHTETFYTTATIRPK